MMIIHILNAYSDVAGTPLSIQLIKIKYLIGYSSGS